MAIGPEASRAASGRIVVIAGFDGVLGIAAVVAGLGPLVRPADLASRAIAVLALAGGGMLIAAGAGLILRRGWSRTIGILGGFAAAALGLIVAILALDVLGSCASMPMPGGCRASVIGVALAGLATSVFGIGSVGVLRRARRGAFREIRVRH